LVGWGYIPRTHTLRGGSCSGWGMCGGWTGRGCQGSCSQRGCRWRRSGWEGVSSSRGELTWGEGVEKVLKCASHALPSADDESTLCAEALPFVPQSLVVGGNSSGRGALARALSGDGGGAPGEAKQRPRPYFVSAADGCYCRDWGGLTGLVCQVCKLRQQQQQHPQRTVLPRVLRRLPQRQRLLPVAPPPKQPLPPPPQQHTQSLRRSSRVRQRTTPASTQYTTSSSCGSGVDDDGHCDGGEFKLDTAPVVAEAAVELIRSARR
jgi:hypothetical protein